MINLLLGPPGGGKSYEAVVYHVLPALNAGRKVITNLPLDLERWRELGFDVSNVEIVTKTKAVRPEVDWQKAQGLYQKFGIAAKTPFWVDRPFAHVEDYGDAWRDPVNGTGPLYVIDECHLAMPAGGTARPVEEWFSLHRHESADVLLITQSFGKVSKSIIDLVQVCYRVKKATAFGSATKYIRKVQDGVRGEVVNTTIREYQKRYFSLYRSHTRGGGLELGAQDVIPIWKRWPFVGAALAFVIAGSLLAFGPASLNPMKNGIRKAEAVPAKVVTEVTDPRGVTTIRQGENGTKSPVHEKVEAVVSDAGLPYEGRTLHIIGSYTRDALTRVWFAVAQNGQQVSQVDSKDLAKLGYVMDARTPCAVRLTNGSWSKWIICDAPQVGIGLGSGQTSDSKHTASDDRNEAGRTRATGAGGSLPPSTSPPSVAS